MSVCFPVGPVLHRSSFIYNISKLILLPLSCMMIVLVSIEDYALQISSSSLSLMEVYCSTGSPSLFFSFRATLSDP